MKHKIKHKLAAALVAAASLFILSIQALAAPTGSKVLTGVKGLVVTAENSVDGQNYLTFALVDIAHFSIAQIGGFGIIGQEPLLSLFDGNSASYRLYNKVNRNQKPA